MKIYSEFKTDEKLEAEGNWLDVGEGGFLKIARLGNKAYKTKLKQLREPFKAYTVRGQDIPDAEADDIVRRAMAETILVGWKGMEDEEGKPLNYSPEAAYKALSGQKDLVELIMVFAADKDNFIHEMNSEVEKKSPSISAIDSAEPVKTKHG